MTANESRRRLQMYLVVPCPEKRGWLAGCFDRERAVEVRIEEVFPAHDGSRRSPAPDAVLIDVGTPGALGAIALARHVFRKALIIALTDGSPDMAFLCGRAGASALASRDLEASALVSLVRALRSGTGAPEALPSLARAEWEYLRAILDLCEGNRSAAARLLGIHRSVLQRKLSRVPPAR